MKEHDETLRIFQDPLTTLIALLLLCTIPAILPIAGRGPAMPPDRSVPAPSAQSDEEVRSLKARLEEAEREVERQKEGLAGLRRAQEDEHKGRQNEFTGRVAALKGEIGQIKIIIQQRKDHREELRRDLDEARARAAATAALADLEAQIASVTAEIGQHEGTLRRLEDVLKAVESEAARPTQPGGVLDVLSKELKSQEDRVRQLETQRKELEGSLTTRPGIGVNSTDNTKNKQQAAFEADKNRLTVINDQNYDFKAYLVTRGNSIVKRVEATRKASVAGEDVGQLEASGSAFRQRLAELDPQTHYLLIVVRPDSFDVFFKARQIGWDKRYVVAWFPLQGVLRAGSGGGSPRGR